MNKTAKKLQKKGFRLVTTTTDQNGEKVFMMERHHSKDNHTEAEVRGNTVNGLTLQEFLKIC